jgi:hypothetical protein
MKRSEAPPAGWYPDPLGGVRLRWWDGSDWTDRYRSRPSPGATGGPDMLLPPLPPGIEPTPPHLGAARADTEALVAQVRQATRAELDRAADVFTARARHATRQIEPIITQYTSRVLNWLRLALIVAVVLIVAWFVFQVVVQASFFDWLGDRIDNLTDDGSG